ncbi:hypothetical protein [Burkholderia gladioli]|uniref:hypothetical protein n=1 Tax=Burkholderia gladioli TaxID=28095 RepID=UPI001391817F|nr:hypothetical protein [Burkholderia gladioli]
MKQSIFSRRPRAVAWRAAMAAGVVAAAAALAWPALGANQDAVAVKPVPASSA